MKSSDIQKKYNKQKKLLFKYNHHYFNLDSPLISDSKYDQIKSEIVKLEKDFPYLVENKSVQDNIGAPITKKFKKIKHSKPMLSLSNTFNSGGMIDFIGKISNYLNIKSKDFSFSSELKIDGISASLSYENGVLVKTDEDWYSAIESLIRDCDLRRRLGEAGRRTVLKNYSVIANRDTYLSIFDSVYRSYH